MDIVFCVTKSIPFLSFYTTVWYWWSIDPLHNGQSNKLHTPLSWPPYWESKSHKNMHKRFDSQNDGNGSRALFRGVFCVVKGSIEINRLPCITQNTTEEQLSSNICLLFCLRDCTFWECDTYARVYKNHCSKKKKNCETLIEKLSWVLKKLWMKKIVRSSISDETFIPFQLITTLVKLVSNG